MSEVKFKRARRLVLIWVMALFSQASVAIAVDSVRVRFSWKMKGEYAHFFLAQEEGFYRRQGLEVSLGEGAGAQAALGSLIQGQEDLVVMPGVFALSAIQKGLPVKIVALYQPRAPVVFLSRSEKPITRPKDLEGKTIAVSVGETGTSYLDMFCQKNGVDCGKITRILVDRNARVAQFLQGQVDAVNLYRSNDLPIVLKKTGQEYALLDMSKYGYAVPGMAVVTSQRNLASRPQVLRRFLVAAAEAIAATRMNVSRATRAIKETWRNSPEDEVVNAQVRATMDSIPESKDQPIGWVHQEVIQEALVFLETDPQFGRPKPAGSYYSNELFK